ncbi:MAG: acyltransferase 3 [Fibrobacteres bacterium]|nr:acyltransferase 3 [Fibrobacterota bacterium]
MEREVHRTPLFFFKAFFIFLKRAPGTMQPPNKPPGSAYRKDIDGLRAVSVLAVILYHLDENLPFNGFVGVDIFFVISGFLITGILYTGIEDSRFSLVGFYVRRIKRILPVFFLVTSCVLAFGILVMLPEDIKSMGKSAFAAVFSGSNVYFWNSRDTDYFARSSNLLPLLHTWSLGIEEQFYLAWPLFLMLMHRIAGFKGLLPVSVILAAASFGYAQYSLHVDASFAYYMLPARAGELLCGAIPFLILRRNGAPFGRTVREAASWSGAALILLAFLLPGVKHAFPGLNAVYPCLGAAILIWSGAQGGTLLSRALSYRPLVYVGLISYSLYLWHWPVLAFGRYMVTVLTPVAMAWSLLAITVLSVLSHRYVESPFRHAKLSAGRTFGTLFLLPFLAISSVSLFLYRTDGLHHWIADKEGYRNSLADLEPYLKPAYGFDYVCQTKVYEAALFNDKRCIVGDTDQVPEVLLIGDSHAAHFSGLFGEIGKRDGFSFRNIEMGDCPPVLKEKIGYEDPRNHKECREFRARMRTEMGKYRIIILGASWANYFPDREFIPDLGETLDYLSGLGKEVIVMAQVPTFESFDRNCALRNNRFFPVDCIGNADASGGSEKQVNAAIEELVRNRPGIHLMDIRDKVCPGGSCSPYLDGKPLYYDRTHLNIPGSWVLGSMIGKVEDPFSRLLAGIRKPTGLN